MEKRREVWGLFETPVSGDSKIIRYHGGVAVVRERSFDFRDDKPEIKKTPVGYDTPFGNYFFQRGCSTPRNLETFWVSVYPDGDLETKRVRRSIEDNLRKNPEFLGRVIALS